MELVFVIATFGMSAAILYRVLKIEKRLKRLGDRPSGRDDRVVKEVLDAVELVRLAEKSMTTESEKKRVLDRLKVVNEAAFVLGKL